MRPLLPREFADEMESVTVTDPEERVELLPSKWVD